MIGCNSLNEPHPLSVPHIVSSEQGIRLLAATTLVSALQLRGASPTMQMMSAVLVRLTRISSPISDRNDRRYDKARRREPHVGCILPGRAA